ncbi:MAG: SpoIIE family protein phosphatase [Leptospiraceae bacterium]|nr:SpoIIE family protein phosphatase [Leptospiraceae bacterium]
MLFSAFFSSEAETLPIDLTLDCSIPECSPRVWWINDSVDETFFPNFQPERNWIRLDSFPININKIYPSHNKVGTYTLLTHFTIELNTIEKNKQTAIRFGEIGEAFEVYLNGKFIHKEGEFLKDKITFHRTLRDQVFELDPTNLLDGKNQLLIRLYGDSKYDHTGFYVTRGYQIGYYKNLIYESRDLLSLILIGIYIIVGLYHLFLYSKRKLDKYNLYFGLYAIGIGIYLYTRSANILEFQIDTNLVQRIELMVLYPMVVTALYFLQYLFFRKDDRTLRYYANYNYLLSFITLFPPMYIAEYILRVWQFSTFLIGFPLLVRIYYKALHKKLEYSMVLFMGFAIAMLCGIYDIIDSAFLNTGLSFTKYGFFTLIMGIATVLARKFIFLHNKMEELNETLEMKVVARTKEVIEKMEEINALNIQQNGDYFLTSLIEKPLSTNFNKSRFIRTEVYIEQKKKFEFRRRNGELGGDIVITGNLRFYNKENRYIFFINGDAMGKSMQGAGGAIVAGTAINNILSRSAKGDRVLQISPDEWMYKFYKELDDIFRTFNGSMLISVVCGLVRESSGEMYLFNAEHPSTVLLRDGLAVFLEKQFDMRKLGTTIDDLPFQLESFCLNPGDILICGSDGRDDLNISTEKSLYKKINEDETLFLRSVEKSKGSLEELVRFLKETGDLTDDLSLIKVHYLEEEPDLDI